VLGEESAREDVFAHELQRRIVDERIGDGVHRGAVVKQLIKQTGEFGDETNAIWMTMMPQRNTHITLRP
jgi:hypothetical protein